MRDKMCIKCNQCPARVYVDDPYCVQCRGEIISKWLEKESKKIDND